MTNTTRQAFIVGRSARARTRVARAMRLQDSDVVSFVNARAQGPLPDRFDNRTGRVWYGLCLCSDRRRSPHRVGGEGTV
jgi:hypothetical protein